MKIRLALREIGKLGRFIVTTPMSPFSGFEGRKGLLHFS
jgi:hypothetical protein